MKVIYIVVGWDCGTGNTESNMYCYRIFLTSTQVVEYLFMLCCVSFGGEKRLPVCVNTAYLVCWYVYFSVCSLPKLIIVWLINGLCHHPMYAHFFGKVLMAALWLNHFQSPYILSVSAWILTVCSLTCSRGAIASQCRGYRVTVRNDHVLGFRDVESQVGSWDPVWDSVDTLLQNTQVLGIVNNTIEQHVICIQHQLRVQS